MIYDDKNDYAKAEPLNLRALAIREKALGPDHPDVAKSLFNLAWIVKVEEATSRRQKRSTGARCRFRRGALGPDHPDVATTLNDLAVLYNQKGDYDKAIQINQRVLAIRERVLGPDDSGVAKALNNLARVYENKGDYPQAETILPRAVPIWEKALGPDHPDVAFAVDGLAKILFFKGDYAAAEPLFLRALAIREKALGPDHPEVATTLQQPGGALSPEGRLCESRTAVPSRPGDHREAAGAEPPFCRADAHQPRRRSTSCRDLTMTKPSRSINAP